jgi:hypothetical protein
VKTRPVGKGAASQLKPWERFVGRALVQILEEMEEEREIEGIEPIVLDNSAVFVDKLEDIAKMWVGGDRQGQGGDEIIEMCTLDIEAMYPALKREYIIEQIDTRLWERIQRAQSLETKTQAVKMRELIMPMLIFTLEHQFVYVLSEGEAEEKVFYYQKQGIGIGSSASGAIANLTLLAGEYAMLERMRTGGLRIMLYKRYIDDIYCIAVKREGEGAGGKMMQRLEAELNALDPVGNSVKVEGKGVEMGRAGGVEGDRVELEFLDVLVGLERGKNKDGVSLDTRIYRKPSASDLYLLPSSAHPPSTRKGLIKGERVRYLRLSSSKENFDRAWNRFRTALLYRGYPKEEIAKVEKELTWEGRESERQKLRERAEEKKERRRGKEGWGKKGTCPGIPIVLPSKPGVQQWWERSMRGSLVELGGLGEEELKRLQPRSRMVKCMSRTPTLGNIF